MGALKNQLYQLPLWLLWSGLKRGSIKYIQILNEPREMTANKTKEVRRVELRRLQIEIPEIKNLVS